MPLNPLRGLKLTLPRKNPARITVPTPVLVRMADWLSLIVWQYGKCCLLLFTASNKLQCNFFARLHGRYDSLQSINTSNLLVNAAYNDMTSSRRPSADAP